MDIIREVSRIGQRCLVRTNTYASSYAHITALVNAAKADFPALQDVDIRVVVYDGDRHKRMMGVEFQPPSPVPATYEEIAVLEYTMN